MELFFLGHFTSESSNVIIIIKKAHSILIISSLFPLSVWAWIRAGKKVNFDFFTDIYVYNEMIAIARFHF